MAQDQTIQNVAEERGIKAAILEFHVRELHGWQPGEIGFEEEVEAIAACKREECQLLIAELEAKAAAAREHDLSADCFCEPTVEQVPAPATV